MLNNLFNSINKSLHTFTRVVPHIFSSENKNNLILGNIAAALGTTFNIVSPLILGEAFKAYNQKGSVELLGKEFSPAGLLILYGATWLARVEFSNLRQYFLAPVGPEAGQALMSEYTEQLMNQSIIDYRKDQMGDKIGRMVPGFEASALLSKQLCMEIIPTLTEMIVTATLLTDWYGWEAACSILGVLTLYTSVAVISKNKVIELNVDARHKANKMYADLESTLSNYETVHFFGKLGYELKNMDVTYQNFAKSSGRAQSIVPIISGIQSFAAITGFTLLCTLIGQDTLKGKYTTNDLIFLIIYLQQFAQQLMEFGIATTQSLAALTQLTSVFDELDRLKANQPPDSGEDLTIHTPTAEIIFENVFFSYKNSDGSSKPILQDVSFRIPAGETLGIVGTSGSGKSTIFNLVFGFLRPDSGRILINGVDISTVSLTSLRQLFGVVPQAPRLFNNTLRYNIMYGAKDGEHVDEEKMARAIDTARLTDFIQSTPDGLNMHIGERGDQLSGGQKQRLAIAMALMKEPKILICDEATAALDANTEKEINENLRRISENISTIIITHRLSILTNVDNIIVLVHGQIIEQGTHTNLLLQDGVYARLWDQQHQTAALEEKLSEIRSQSPSRHMNFFQAEKPAEETWVTISLENNAHNLMEMTPMLNSRTHQ